MGTLKSPCCLCRPSYESICIVNGQLSLVSSLRASDSSRLKMITRNINTLSDLYHNCSQIVLSWLQIYDRPRHAVRHKSASCFHMWGVITVSCRMPPRSTWISHTSASDRLMQLCHIRRSFRGMKFSTDVERFYNADRRGLSLRRH